MSAAVPGAVPGAVRDAVPDTAPDFAVAPYLREIGRGKRGARGLTCARAQELMAAILEGRVGELALGGVLLALRMKGEEAEEIEGFLAALEGHLDLAPAALPGWVVLPSYNGSRSQPNLLPLLAMRLAQAGLPVLVHGQASEPLLAARPRVTSASIFALMGVPDCVSLVAAPARVQEGLPAVVPLDAFAPALARLIALRPVLGVRNVAHTLVKLLRPVRGASLLISSFTHPDFGQLQAELFRRSGQAAMSLRGTEGESVLSARRAQAIELWNRGQCRTIVPRQAEAASDAGLPAPDAAATAAWTLGVLRGEAAAPAPIEEQVAAIRDAVRDL